MSFLTKDRSGTRENDYCRIHGQRIVQLGNCLTCSTVSSICETKGCIKHHEENERIHNVVTVEYIRHIVREFQFSDQKKKSMIKKLVADYFTVAKKELDILYNEIYEAVDLFKFDNIILREDEIAVVQKLINEEYNEITCADIAIIVPKLIKCTNYEDGHFAHIRGYLKNEKEKLPALFDEIILNLPYFRESIKRSKEKETVDISSDLLRDVNEKLKNISIKPKRIRIRYSRHMFTQSTTRGRNKKVLDVLLRSKCVLNQRDFIRNLCTLEKLNNIEEMELYCLWDVQDEDFQVAFF